MLSSVALAHMGMNQKYDQTTFEKSVLEFLA